MLALAERVDERRCLTGCGGFRRGYGIRGGCMVVTSGVIARVLALGAAPFVGVEVKVPEPPLVARLLTLTEHKVQLRDAIGREGVFVILSIGGGAHIHRSSHQHTTPHCTPTAHPRVARAQSSTRPRHRSAPARWFFLPSGSGLILRPIVSAANACAASSLARSGSSATNALVLALPLGISASWPPKRHACTLLTSISTHVLLALSLLLCLAAQPTYPSPPRPFHSLAPASRVSNSTCGCHLCPYPSVGPGPGIIPPGSRKRVLWRLPSYPLLPSPNLTDGLASPGLSGSVLGARFV
ncbi:hypothetical protein B0H19DRAFT_1249190 [Mycena capillaripes]|nr:hypothetical protein B0H19DRAFT_1249190 [Mycena capillaripes]